MYSKFKVKISEDFYDEIEYFKQKGDDLYKKAEENIKKPLEEFLTSKKHLDGDLIIKTWFQPKKYDIFLSHSHKDLDKVKAFAGWLNVNFGLKCFIDSCVWEYCDNLLKDIDDNYCYNSQYEMYDYRKRNCSTSHVHIMLATALTSMMDSSECLMFFNTPNSVSICSDIAKNTYVTYSPWIYYELYMSYHIRKTPLRRACTEGLQQDSLSVQYDTSEFLDEMKELTEKELKTWKNEMRGNRAPPLDVLYDIFRQINMYPHQFRESNK